MTKNFIKYIVASCFLISISGCEDFLTEENKSNVTSDKYFSEAEGYESLVTAAYSTLRDFYKGEPWLFCLGVDIYTRGESELVGGSYQNSDVYSRQLNEYGELDSFNQFVSDFYASAYKAIQTCNTAIVRSAAVTELAVNKKERLVSEVRFLRAYYYFQLVEQFGDIAIVEEEINSAITHFDKTPEEDVYKFIINELEDVKNKLPVHTDEFGRATQGAAKNLLALVYLTRGYKQYANENDFSSAAIYADEVINSGQYKLCSTFESLFTPGNEKNDEIIFSVQYNVNTLGNFEKGGNRQAENFGWELWTKVYGGFDYGNITYGRKKSQFTPTQFLYSLFDTNIDSRYDATFKSEFYATIDVPEVNVKEGDLRVYFPKYDQSFSRQDSLDFMVRHPQAIIITKDRWKQDIEKVGGAGMYPMVWKFYDPKALFPRSDHFTGTRDIYLFRLAETYLIAAEAYCNLKNNDEAAKRVNAVRQRAAFPGQQSLMEAKSSSISIDFILDERARELVGEYKRWMDLKRTGKLIERTLRYNNLAEKINKLDKHHLLRPIPQTVIDQDNGSFTQNPGY